MYSENISLATLLAGIVIVDPIWDRDITGIEIDSRVVKQGNLFIAYPGVLHDGRNYIDAAIENGATAILVESQSKSDNAFTKQKNIPVFYAKDIQQEVGKLAARFYGNPSRAQTIIGITGTNGKTSCSHFVAQAFTELGITCGVIGTLGNGILPNLDSTQLTTPDGIRIQSTLRHMLDQDVHTVAMEVSSHALVQGRIRSLEITTAIFTNLTQDHLDFHGDMKSYGEAKLSLFKQFGLKNAIINKDDAFSQQVLKVLPSTVKAYRYSTDDTSADVYLSDIVISEKGMQATIHSPWGEGKLNTVLLGKFNLSNLLAVVTSLCVHEIPLKNVLKCIPNIKGVSGRMQVFRSENHPTLVVDYAHTPDALRQTLLSLRKHCHGKLWNIFGCGGDRDNDKRAKMAAVSDEFADISIVTNDNPRGEDPQVIIQQILQGFAEPDHVTCIPDREKAIRYAYQQANHKDIILIAGKGHENYQIIGNERIDYSDLTVAENLIR